MTWSPGRSAGYQPRGSVRTYVSWDMPISRQSDIMLSSNFSLLNLFTCCLFPVDECALHGEPWQGRSLKIPVRVEAFAYCSPRHCKAWRTGCLVVVLSRQGGHI